MAILVTIKVVPQSGKQLCKIDKGGILRCYLKSPPEQGKANEELIKFLSKELSIPQNSIKIIRGATTRTKTIYFETFNEVTSFFEQLGLEQQTNLDTKS